jgi:tRNA nucleotidyltransferase/poly(A) polymerase
MASVERTDNFMAALGAEAYRVGGSVRDELLGRKVKDADYMVRGVDLFKLGGDLSTAARALGYTERMAVTPLKLRDGRQAGWRVSARGLGLVEVVLPRTEVPREALPGENTHRAFDIKVNPEVSLYEDAQRRDFTFNALYKNVHTGEVLDPIGTGLYDLQHKLVRTTHEDSFRDDPLRTLRALRFVSTLGYDLTQDTQEQMTKHAPAVTGLSAKGYASGTVLDELSRLLMGQYPAKALRLARNTGVLAVLLPELAPMLDFDQGSRYHDLTTDEHTFAALETAAHVDAPLRVRMALLFHDAGKPESAWVGEDSRKHYYASKESDTEDHEVVGARIWDEVSARLNAERTLRNDVRTLILNHMVPCVKCNPVKVRRARVRLGDALLRDLYLMRMCDLSGKGKKNLSMLAKIAEMESERQRAERTGVPCGPKDLQINGNDVKALGAEGRRIGEVLAAVLDEVVCDPAGTKLTREWQLARAEALA